MQPPQQVPFQVQPGQQPTPEQIQAFQQQISREAARNNMSVPKYIELIKKQQLQMQQQKQQQYQQGQTQGQQPGTQNQPPPSQGQNQEQAQQQKAPAQQQHSIPLNNPPPPTPEALAVAEFLRSQDLKTRACLYQEKRRDLFRVKRAIRALMSPQYEKACTKNKSLPPVTDRVSAENVFKRLPMSLLALQVEKVIPHEGHGHATPKRIKGFWTVKLVSQQEANDDCHYVWIFEGSQLKQKIYSGLALAGVIAIVMFPLWPLILRQGVWYLSMGFLGLLGLFLALTIFRLVLFCVTVFAFPPGLWLYPNLLEDVGFFASFSPIWGWQETPEERKQKRLEKRERREQRKLKLDKSGQAAAATVVQEPSVQSSPLEPTAAPAPPQSKKGKPVATSAKVTSTALEESTYNAQPRATFKAYVEEDDDNDNDA